VIGRQLGHYVVQARLGSGGMGDVYLALDTRLNRRVALKLPRGEASASPDRLALVRREARAAAALNHPNIVHLYAIEEADGLIFMTMELVDGRSLRERLQDISLLPLSSVLGFATQIAGALACAHAAGVLHRDLKPGNVMITADERVKILDFGVATFFRPASSLDADAVTTLRDASSGRSTVGTIGYMSPEQALGRTLDGRTDLFALGVILYEMATGRRPFQGDTAAAVFDELLNRQPPSPQAANPALPASLVGVIDRALEKDPERRYRSAGELLADLRRVEALTRQGHPASRDDIHLPRVPPEARPPASVVVLPFVDMSPGRDQEYFCHGITEEIINTLTKVPGLRVISRTSAFAFQGTGLDVTEIGRRLRVGTALEGSVRKSGDRVRISSRLVNAEDGYQVWSRRFDRELSDVFAIQDEIAASIVSELRLELATGAAAAARLDTSAHEAYLRGIYALNKWTPASVAQAMADLRTALAQDPGFAPAHAALADALIWLYSGVGSEPAARTVPEARSAVDRALAIDPTLAHAHRVRALIAMNHDWDRAATEAALSRALQLAPGSAAAHLWNAWRLALLERQHDLALTALDQAERLDPLDLQIKTLIGYVHCFRHDFPRAIEQFERAMAMDPNFAFAHYALGDICTGMGQHDRAIEEFGRAIELGGRLVNHVGVLGYAYGRAGHRDRARGHLQELVARAPHEHVSPIWTGLVHLGLDERDDLFRCLDRAYEERDGSLILITAAVEFDPVRDDPKFRSLLERMGLAHLI
jgi:serine/threonine protein kinase/Tfp pilus assembly protein PilF